jgi:hypothetical protein
MIYWLTYGHVIKAISGSGMVENVEVAVGIAPLSIAVQKLFLPPVYGQLF